MKISLAYIFSLPYIFLFAAYSFTLAESIDENALFSDSNSVVDSSTLVGNVASVNANTDKKSLGISGKILGRSQVGAARDYFSEPDSKFSSLYSNMVGDAYIDARLLRGYKAYANLEWSADSVTAFRVPEMFLDANFDHKIYFRFGKQILQWGRCYFFNPTDLINIESKTFLQRIGGREGTLGTKLHIPFGTAANIYGFLNLNQVNRPDSLAGSLKAEFLTVGTEFSFMVYDKGGHIPVYGADISTRVLGIDLNGEVALYPELKTKTLAFAGPLPQIVENKREWSPKISIGAGKAFTVGGFKDRLNLVTEYYYNPAGDGSAYMFGQNGAQLLSQLNSAAAIGAGTGTNSATISNQISSGLLSSGIYQPNSYSKNYAAFFASFSRFLIQDLTLSFNALGNLDQNSATVSSGIGYRDLNDFGISVNINGFLGPVGTEYVLQRQALQAQIILDAAF